MNGSEECGIAVVTGGTGALGREVVRALVQDGWRVRVPFRSEEGAEALRESLGTSGPGLGTHRVDVTDPEAVAAFFGEIAAEGAPVGALCNLVGGFTMASLEDTDPSTWDRMMELNTRSAFLCTRAALPGLRAGGGGSVLNVAALPAVERGTANMAAYAASKAAVVSLTHSLARELRPHGITVNALAPEIIDTEDNRSAMPDADRSAWLAPAEIARVVAFLVGRDARIVTGSVLMLAKG